MIVLRLKAHKVREEKKIWRKKIKKGHDTCKTIFTIKKSFWFLSLLAVAGMLNSQASTTNKFKILSFSSSARYLRYLSYTLDTNSYGQHYFLFSFYRCIREFSTYCCCRAASAFIWSTNIYFIWFFSEL